MQGGFLMFNEEIEKKYKDYLYRNFSKLFIYADRIDEYNNSWYKELVAYNNIIGSLIGLIDGKGNSEELKNCKDFVLRYYEQTYPEKQLESIDNALFSKKCSEYLDYATANLTTDKRDLEILKSFIKAYSLGKKVSKDVSLRSVLPYYSKKIYKYEDIINKQTEKQL